MVLVEIRHTKRQGPGSYRPSELDGGFWSLEAHSSASLASQRTRASSEVRRSLFSRSVRIAEAGVLLYRIAFWQPRATRRLDDGAPFIARTAEEWCGDETGLTAKQYRRALKRLRDDGHVESEYAVFGTRRMLHVRLSGGAMWDLVGQGDQAQEGVVPRAPQGAVSRPCGATPLGPLGPTDITMQQTSNNKGDDPMDSHPIGSKRGGDAKALMAAFETDKPTLEDLLTRPPSIANMRRILGCIHRNMYFGEPVDGWALRHALLAAGLYADKAERGSERQANVKPRTIRAAGHLPARAVKSAGSFGGI